MLAAVKELSPHLSIRRACELVGYSRATWHRRQRPASKKKPRCFKRANSLKLTPSERASFLAIAQSPEYIDRSPPQIFFSLLDVGCYICSVRTMFRLLAEEGQLRDRRNQLMRPRYQRPELLATGPNQLWSWDITKLRGPQKGTYYHLYVVIDVYSRYVVGWLIASRESEDLAASLLHETYAKQRIEAGELTVHADRGASMTSKTVVDLLEKLEVSRTHSRPGVSDDNPYSESQFKTAKYHPSYPDRFGSVEDARAWARQLFRWYNYEHYHSGICWLTPSTVHYGCGPSVLARRHQTMQSFYEASPQRFIRGAPRLYTLPTEVWINRPYDPKSH